MLGHGMLELDESFPTGGTHGNHWDPPKRLGKEGGVH